MRPVATPVKVFSGARGEILSATAGGRVALVNARIGDVVRQGDVLVRLETTRLENEIAKQAPDDPGGRRGTGEVGSARGAADTPV